MIFQHGRYQIWNIGQHPYRHAPEDIAYTTAASGGLITNIGQAMDWIFAVLYPNLESSVPDPASLPLVGNTLNDYRVVEDDGDGRQAGYRWEQREGDVAPQWYKIYDFDWSSDAILAAFLDITQDEYVHKQGRDDADETGTPLAGDLAGQHVYGGVTAGTHLTLHANAGDGVGAQTGFVQTEDPLRPFPGTTLDLGTTTERWNRVWCTSAQVDTMLISTGSIIDSTGAIDFDDETLTTSTSVTAGTLTISSGSIIDTSGTIDFGNENLTTTGTVTCDNVQALGSASAFFTGTTIGTLTLSDGSIIDSTGAIDFDDEDLSTTGTLDAGATTVPQIDAGNIRIINNNILATNLNGNVDIGANGTGVIDLQSDATTLDLDATGTITATVEVSAANLRMFGDRLQNDAGNVNIVPTGGYIGAFGSIIPSADNTYYLGAGGATWNRLYLGGWIVDSANNFMPAATITSFRDANIGVNVGDALFWTGTKWEASNPDTEIDHGELTGILDDDHTQYMLLAGRTGGQTLNGSTDASEDLTLSSTANVTKGFVTSLDDFRPGSDGDRDLGTSGRRWDDLYMSGEGIGFRMENAANFAGLPAASASNPGRLAWDLAGTSMYVDTGGTWLQVSTDQYYEENAVDWDGVATSVSYDVSATVTNAKRMVWQFKDNSDDYAIVAGAYITHTSDTNVTVTFDTPPAAGTYTLVGR